MTIADPSSSVTTAARMPISHNNRRRRFGTIKFEL
jgi:hypothetical protein